MLKLSARNPFAGTITGSRKGVTTTHVTIEVAPGVVFTAAITNDAAGRMAGRVEHAGLAGGGQRIEKILASRQGRRCQRFKHR